LLTGYRKIPLYTGLIKTFTNPFLPKCYLFFKNVRWFYRIFLIYWLYCSLYLVLKITWTTRNIFIVCNKRCTVKLFNTIVCVLELVLITILTRMVTLPSEQRDVINNGAYATAHSNSKKRHMVLIRSIISCSVVHLTRICAWCRPDTTPTSLKQFLLCHCPRVWRRFNYKTNLIRRITNAN